MRHSSYGTQGISACAGAGWGCSEEVAHPDSDRVPPRAQREVSTGCQGRDTQVRFQSSKISLFAPVSVLMFDIQA